MVNHRRLNSEAFSVSKDPDLVQSMPAIYLLIYNQIKKPVGTDPKGPRYSDCIYYSPRSKFLSTSASVCCC